MKELARTFQVETINSNLFVIIMEELEGIYLKLLSACAYITERMRLSY